MEHGGQAATEPLIRPELFPSTTTSEKTPSGHLITTTTFKSADIEDDRFDCTYEDVCSPKFVESDVEVVGICLSFSKIQKSKSLFNTFI